MAHHPRLAFIFNPVVDSLRLMGEALARQYDGVAPDQADILVPLGGDGSVLFALKMAKGRTVYGLKAENSNSVAYTANNFDPAEDLYQAIKVSKKFQVSPLDAHIHYLDGTQKHHDVYNSINIVRDSGQAAMMDLAARFNGVAQTIRVVGDGVAFSTPLGSTGLAYSQGGPIMSLARPAIIFTGMGLGRPRGLNPIIGGSFPVCCMKVKMNRNHWRC